MTVYIPAEFEAEALDLDRVPDESEFFPDDPTHWLGGYDGEVRLPGTRRKYKVLIRIGGDESGVGLDIITISDIAQENLANHAGQGQPIRVTIGVVTFMARIIVVAGYDGPTIADLFRHEPIDWGLRGDPYLWKDMRDRFLDWLLPDSIEELDGRIRRSFEELAGASIDSKEPIFNPNYDTGGMSSGHIDPQFWRTQALEHLRRQFEYDKGWKRPNCPDCNSDDVAEIVYGFPGPEMIQGDEDRRIKLGGCCVSENDPEWHCWQCEREW